MIRLGMIFQDGMVLQRDRQVRLWGSTDRNQTIYVCIDDVAVAKRDVEAGDFEIDMPPQKAMEDVTLKVKGSEAGLVELHNVDIGEVWIAGGQSNMEFMLCCDREWEQTREEPQDEHIRFIDIGEYSYLGERAETENPVPNWDKWLKATDAENLGYFSAIGYYFAHYIKKEIGVPVGIVGCNWGGTSASTWLSRSILENDPDLSVYVKEYEAAVKDLDLEKFYAKDKKARKRRNDMVVSVNINMVKNESLKPPSWKIKFFGKIISKLFDKMNPHHQNRPGGLYESMLCHIYHFEARGVIWYQGESDSGYADIYGKLFTRLIECWREDWGQELPFYYVQLAPFESWNTVMGHDYPRLRQQQQLVEDSVDRTYMASIMDIGSRYDIHPKDKKPVGKRLAALALNHEYGIDNPCRAPRIAGVERVGIDKIRVDYDYARTGLHYDSIDGATPMEELFQIENPDTGEKLDIHVNIENGNAGYGQVFIRSNSFANLNKIKMSFAYMPYCKDTLYDKLGFCARPMAPATFNI